MVSLKELVKDFNNINNNPDQIKKYNEPDEEQYYKFIRQSLCLHAYRIVGLIGSPFHDGSYCDAVTDALANLLINNEEYVRSTPEELAKHIFTTCSELIRRDMVFFFKQDNLYKEIALLTAVQLNGLTIIINKCDVERLKELLEKTYNNIVELLIEETNVNIDTIKEYIKDGMTA